MDANPLHSFGADLVFGELFNAEGAEAAEEFRISQLRGAHPRSQRMATRMPQCVRWAENRGWQYSFAVTVHPNKSAADWINELMLEPHPEGGYFRQTYRSDLMIAREALPPGFAGARAASTAIYFLLEGKKLLGISSAALG